MLEASGRKNAASFNIGLATDNCVQYVGTVSKCKGM